MADISKVLFVNASGVYEEVGAADSLKAASFKTASYELSDTLLGKLVNAINSSAGAGDAGKFILTDAGGKIDASFVDSSDVDHDSTNGVSASTAHLAFPLLVGGRSFTAIQRYDSAKTYSNDYEIVDKKYVDDQVAALGTQAEWQDSVISVQVDNTLDPGASPTLGDRYILTDVANLNANFGSIAGVADDDIVEYNGSAFVVAYSPTTRTYTSADDETDSLRYYTGSAWTQKFYESTTASLGCKKVGVDIQADLLANGGLELSGNSLRVNVDDSSIELDGSGNVQVKADGIDDTHIDFGTGANQVNAADIPIIDAGAFTDQTDVEGALQEIYGVIGDGEGVDYIAGTGGVSKGDLVYVSGNDTASTYSTLSADERVPGIALSTKAATETVRVAANDMVCEGVLTGATAGDVYYWTGSALSTTPPSGGGSHVWQAGVAKNATDLHVEVRLVKKNA